MTQTRMQVLHHNTCAVQRTAEPRNLKAEILTQRDTAWDNKSLK